MNSSGTHGRENLNMSDSRIFRYSRWDTLSLAAIPFQAAFYILLACVYRELSIVALVALVPVLYLLSLQNAGANHNHYHTPIFRARWLNTLARMGFSLTGAPKTPYNIGHGIHHAKQVEEAFNNASALAILGLRRPLHRQLLGFVFFIFESFGLKYIVLLILLKRWPIDRLARVAMPQDIDMATRVLQKVQKPGTLRAVKLDLGAWLAFRLILCAIDWQFFLFYFIPTSYLIETFRQIDNYTQHWGATDPDDPKRDAVSCYGTFYNLLTFNLGYHQEHHLHPAVHWLDLPEVTKELPLDRRTVPLTHYINLPMFYPALAAALARTNAAARDPSIPASSLR
jgi:fatty acid desaturase